MLSRGSYQIGNETDRPSILHESKHYSGYTPEELVEEFEVEESDDYYEEFKIIEKNIEL